MQNLTFLSFSMQAYACYRAQSLHTSGALITLYLLLVRAIRDDPAIQQSNCVRTPLPTRLNGFIAI